MARKSKVISRPKRNGKLRPKDERFCQAVASGMSGAAAYRTCIALGECSSTTAQNGAYMLRCRPDIKERISQIESTLKNFVEQELGFGQRQMARYLVDALQTPLSEIDESHPLAQKIKKSRRITGSGEDAEVWEVEQIESVGKLDAGEKLIKLMGWYPNTGGSDSHLPAVVINFGGVYSPQLNEGHNDQRTIRILHGMPLDALPVSSVELPIAGEG